ncbi:hypothetical protein HanXRQr2_Chr09g0373961 [Helianthus annuus]|uniref:Uncharacterized protein n=1 Tax=Helianthus annuus TaxID=4232 RepID=A0A251TT60_HELAN|nr:hypothetical protein HanXRQr2_Chr09g0373961 [Helianthus annuus]KAJ0891981.1 hypothetical protein HanPSC8_Chr09g0360451 [Helianthus annuus]
MKMFMIGYLKDGNRMDDQACEEPNTIKPISLWRRFTGKLKHDHVCRNFRA